MRALATHHDKVPGEIDTAPSLGPSNDEGVLPEEWERATSIAKLARKNLRFMHLAPADKRVALAKDVLQWLRAKKLFPLSGVYVGNISNSDNNETVDGGQCNACALGALVACHVEREATLQAPSVKLCPGSLEVASRSSISAALSGYFEPEQLCLIECAFEVTVYFGRRAQITGKWDTSDADTCIPQARDAGHWCHGVTASRRMTAIMNNIVANHGTFDPSTPPDYKL